MRVNARYGSVLTAMVVILSGVAVIPAGPASAAAFLPTGFKQATTFSGLSQPTATAFAPDGAVYIAEKRGIVKAYSSVSDTSATTTIDLRRNVFNWADRGMGGIAVDPQYPTRPYVYFTYTFDALPGGEAPQWGGTQDTDGCSDSTNGCVATGRVSRVRVNPSTGAAVGPEEPLVTDFCQQFSSHSIDDIMFGPDGMLYVSAGEGGSFSFVDWGQLGNPCQDPPTPTASLTPPSAQGGSLRSQSARRAETERASLSGSIIRIDPETGAAAPGNPFAGSADTVRRSIIGYGLRNPYRFDFRPGTNELWVGDVGNNTTEEINVLADVTDGTAENFGWPCYEGIARHSTMDNANLTSCETLYTEQSATVPTFRYTHDVKIVAGEPCTTGSSSISALAFYPGGSFPAKYHGGLFFGDYSRSCLWFVPAGAQGRPDFSKVETFATADGSFRPVDVDLGPGGDLFVTDISGVVRRFSPESGNQAPTARVSATPSTGSAPLTVTLDARASSDPEGGQLTYSWDTDGDGTFGDATTATVTRTYETPGGYNVSVRVTDPAGATGSASTTVSVGNDAPTAAITAPEPGTTWAVGDRITLTGAATDAQDGDLPATSLSWSAFLQHCPSNCHSHPLGTWPDVDTIEFLGPDHEYPAHLEVRLTATDSGGLTATTTRRLDPATSDIAFVTQPEGLKLTSFSETTTTPFTRRVIVGSLNSVSAPLTQTSNGRTYEFQSWSDGGAATHEVTAGTEPMTLTAVYRDSGDAGGDTTPPTAPTDVALTRDGSTVTLTWEASEDDTGVSQYVVYRSETQGFTPNSATRVGTTTEAPWSQAGVPPGRYYYRVVAEDAAGNASAPSAEVDVVVPAADTTPPNAPVGLAGMTAGSETSLWWTPPSGEAVASYEVHRAQTESFEPSATNRVDTTADPRWSAQTVPTGTWYYRVVARDAAGNRSDATSALRSVVSFGDATTVVRDEFRRSNASGWGTAPLGGAWSVSSAARFSVAEDRGRITNDAAATDRTAWLAASDVRDVEVAMVFRTDTKALTGNGQTVKILTRRQASYHEYRTALQLKGDGSLSIILERIAPNLADVRTTVAVPGGFVRGRDYALRTTVTGVNPTTIRAKVWDASTSEPTAWRATWTDSTSTLQRAGDVGIASYVSSSASGTPVTSGVEAFVAASAAAAPAPPDTAAPSAPGTPSTTVSGSNVSVSWGAATDNVGVDAYRVYRGTTSGFTVGSSTLRATLAGTATTWQDQGVAAGSWYYRVVAVDAAGNAGSASASALAVVQAPPAQQTLQVVASADTWVNSSAATATAGTSWVLRAKGASGTQVPYLRFVLPSAPPGRTLTAARLELATSANDWAGSASSYEVRRVDNNTWVESTMTWNSRPAVSTTVLGTFPAGSAPSRSYSVPLTVAGLPGAGGAVSMALTGSSADNIELVSKENPTVKPTLILTYS